MTAHERVGYERAKGALRFLGRVLVIGGLFILGFSALRNELGWGVDDSDLDGWNRSGLTIHVDQKTGVEYLSDGHGGLVVRQPAPGRLGGFSGPSD